jgi:acetyl-CoA carboxylase carboxyltransferase component
MSTAASQLSAKERIYKLLDNNSFVEIGALVTKRNTDFNMSQAEVPSDGVVSGYGLIDGDPVYVYSQDGTVLGGSIGEMHAKKITHIYDLAIKSGVPVIGLLDSAGLRLQEATDALNAFGEIYKKQSEASGIIPQITAILGKCGGGLAIMAALSDFTIMEEKNARLFVNSPNSLSGNYLEKNDTSAAKFQAEAGNVDIVCEDEAELFEKIRELVTLVPANNEEAPRITSCSDDLNRRIPSLMEEAEDGARVLKDISDSGFLYEVKSDYAKEMVTAFIRLNGMTVGAIANRTKVLDDENKAAESFDGKLSEAGCRKAASFVKFCDAFHIPLLTLTDVTGFRADLAQEKEIAKAAAVLTNAFAEATVPKVNVITGNAFGSAYITMNSRHIGADLVFALPDAKIGMMEPELAAMIMYDSEDKEAVKEKASEYEKLQASAESAAKRGYVDSIIEPEALRQHMIMAFEMLFTKSEAMPFKKHGSI